MVNSNPKPNIHTFGTLGWETAARILWIRDSVPANLNALCFIRDDIGCGYCSSTSSLLNVAFDCNTCGQAVPPDAELTVPGNGPKVMFKDIQCKRIGCRGPAFSSIYIGCKACTRYHPKGVEGADRGDIRRGDQELQRRVVHHKSVNIFCSRRHSHSSSTCFSFIVMSLAIGSPK